MRLTTISWISTGVRLEFAHKWPLPACLLACFPEEVRPLGVLVIILMFPPAMQRAVWAAWWEWAGVRLPGEGEGGREGVGGGGGSGVRRTGRTKGEERRHVEIKSSWRKLQGKKKKSHQGSLADEFKKNKHVLDQGQGTLVVFFFFFYNRFSFVIRSTGERGEKFW